VETVFFVIALEFFGDSVGGFIKFFMAEFFNIETFYGGFLSRK
jgi:hypothetical protein